MISYLLQMGLFQLLFLGLYQLVFRYKTFFGINRFYLLGSCVLSLVLPLIKLDVLATGTIPTQALNHFSQAIIYLEGVELSARSNSLGSADLILSIWGVGATAMLLLFFRKLHTLYVLYMRGNRSQQEGYTLIRLENSSEAFSFFRWVFLGDRQELREHLTILRHESVHIQHWHSLDLLVLEILRLPMWFNPLLWMYQRLLMEVHEFKADAIAVRHGKKEYYESLLFQVLDTPGLTLVNPFFRNSLIKKRIVMLRKKSSPNAHKLIYSLCIPVLTLMIFITSCRHETSENQVYSNSNLEELGAVLKALNEKSEDPSLSATEREAAREKAYLVQLQIKEITILAKSEANSDGSSVVNREAAIPGQGDVTVTDLVSFSEIDQVPVFPGCENASDQRSCFNQKIQEHIKKNFSYPEEALKQEIEGRVNVLFRILPDGKIRDIQLQGTSPILEEEVKRIIARLPDMVKPGMHAGQPVIVPYSIPVVFKLN